MSKVALTPLLRHWLSCLIAALVTLCALSGVALASTPIKAQTSAGAAVADRELKAMLQQQRSLGCVQKQNTLQSILCQGEIRIGIRTSYKAFGQSVNGELVGFEIDYAKYIADKLGVKPVFVPVTAANRIKKLVDGDIDLILATMAHTPVRAQIVSFIRPHYYSSPTAVAGFKERQVSQIADLNNVALCVPLGSYSNIAFAQAQARILIFSKPQQMFDALRFGACDLVAHDRSLILAEVTGQMAPASMREHFDEKFSFNEIAWGMAVRHGDAATLGRAVELITAQAHSQGVLISMASQHGVQTPFLEEQRRLWSEPKCYLPGGGFALTCLLEPPQLGDPPSAIGLEVKGFEQWLADTIGLQIRLPMLSGEQGLRLFLEGIWTSLILVTGSIIGTILAGLMFYRLSVSPWMLVRVPSNALRIMFLNAPLILFLVLTYLLISSVFLYTGTVAVITALIVIGLDNGASAGEALVQAKKTLPKDASTARVAMVSAVQFRACVINAAKASPVAAFIGAPELLSVLTDITSFSGERVASFTVLAVFYLLVVQMVVIGSAFVVRRLQALPHGGAHA